MRREHKDIWNRICLVYEKKKNQGKEKKRLRNVKKEPG
jgi:hypothetical protein